MNKPVRLSGLSVQAFSCQKAGNARTEYEDAWAIRGCRVAVADGATESSFSALWAALLALAEGALAANPRLAETGLPPQPLGLLGRSEEHTSELQSPSVISYAVFCLDRKSVV